MVSLLKSSRFRIWVSEGYIICTVLDESALEVHVIRPEIHDVDLIQLIIGVLTHPNLHIIQCHVLICHLKINTVVRVQSIQTESHLRTHLKGLLESENVAFGDGCTGCLVIVCGVLPDEQGHFGWVRREEVQAWML